MRVFLFSLLILLVVCPIPHNIEHLTHHERLQRRKKFQKEIIDCVLNSEISKSLKEKLEENKEKDLREMIHLFMNKVDTKDKEIIRKCRREIFSKMRDMFRLKRHDHFVNRTRFRKHLFDNDNEEDLPHHRRNHTLLKEHEIKETNNVIKPKKSTSN